MCLIRQTYTLDPSKLNKLGEIVVLIKSYSGLQKALHWTAALLILQQYVFKESISKAWDAVTLGAAIEFNPLVAAHVFGGLMVFALVIWRIVLRRSNTASEKSATNSPQEHLAKAVHLLLYLTMLLLPISGALAWFGGVQNAASMHNVLKIVMILSIALHIVGALYHKLILKDDILERMLPDRQ